MNRQKALILGAGGFIGSSLVTRVLSCNAHDDYQIQAVGRSISLPDTSRLQIISGEIDADLLLRCECPDVIFHCAGGASVATSVADPHTDFMRTLPQLSALLNHMRTKWPDSKLIYLSSAAVYGANASANTSIATPLAPISPYGLHKKMAEELIQYYAATFSLQTKIVRPFSVYGEGLRKQLFWDALHKARRGEFTYFGSGEQKRDWIYVDDLVKFLLMLAEQPFIEPAAIVNAGTGQAKKIRLVITRLLHLAGYTRQPIFSFNTKTGDPDDLVSNSSEQLGFSELACTPLDEGMKRYIAWFNSEMDRDR